MACDVGGTRLKLGVVCGGAVVARRELPAEPARGWRAALGRIAGALPELIAEARTSREALSGFALAFPGIIDPRTERIVSTPAGKFDDALDCDFSRWVREHAHDASFVCNDANAALAGEWTWGAARGRSNIVMVTLGTGFGSSVIIEGVPLRGAHGQAGSLGGHLLANIHGRACRCGSAGCVETEASTWILPELARRSGAPPAAFPDYATVFDAAAAGDAAAERIKAHSLHTWSAAIVSLIHAYDPECVVVGGGIMASAAAILPELRRHVERHAWTPWGRVEIVAAHLGRNAGLIGAAHLLREKLERGSR